VSIPSISLIIQALLILAQIVRDIIISWRRPPTRLGSPLGPLIDAFTSLFLALLTSLLFNHITLLTLLAQFIVYPSEIGNFEEIKAVKGFFDQVLFICWLLGGLKLTWYLELIALCLH